MGQNLTKTMNLFFEIQDTSLDRRMWVVLGLWRRWKRVGERLIMVRDQMWGERVWKNAFRPAKQQIEVRGWASNHTLTLKSTTWTLLGDESLQALWNGGWRLKKTSTLFVCVFVMSMRKMEPHWLYIIYLGYPATWHISSGDFCPFWYSLILYLYDYFCSVRSMFGEQECSYLAGFVVLCTRHRLHVVQDVSAEVVWTVAGLTV